MVEQQKEKSRGCLYYGCLIMVVLVILVVGLAGFGLYKLRNTALEYTDTKPLELPQVTMDPGELDVLKDKVTAFSDEVENGEETARIELTDREINALISDNPDWQNFDGRFFVKFDDGRVSGAISLPLDELPLKLAKGRYLNGSGVFNVYMNKGLLIVNLEDLTVKGQPVPEPIMEELRKHNLAQDAYDDVETAKVLARVQTLEIQGDKLVMEIGPK